MSLVTVALVACSSDSVGENIELKVEEIDGKEYVQVYENLYLDVEGLELDKVDKYVAKENLYHRLDMQYTVEDLAIFVVTVHVEEGELMEEAPAVVRHDQLPSYEAPTDGENFDNGREWVIPGAMTVIDSEFPYADSVVVKVNIAAEHLPYTTDLEEAKERYEEGPEMFGSVLKRFEVLETNTKE